jgi:hypothetical protein
MANELLDFVISLVRDPAAAARYAADPVQAIADAQLTGVTSVDVNNLLPMVSDSLSMADPPLDVEDSVDGNVWTSGAATAAFDAFTPPDAVVAHTAPPVTDPTTLPEPAAIGAEPVRDYTSTLDGFDTSHQVSGNEVTHPAFEDGVVGIDDNAGWETWDHTHEAFPPGHPGFEILD